MSTFIADQFVRRGSARLIYTHHWVTIDAAQQHNSGVLHTASEFLHDSLGCRNERIQRTYLTVTRVTGVQTDKHVVAVDGVFTVKLGEPLELVTMANSSKRLCASDSAESCRPLANYKKCTNLE